MEPVPYLGSQFLPRLDWQYPPTVGIKLSDSIYSSKLVLLVGFIRGEGTVQYSPVANTIFRYSKSVLL